MCRHNSVRSRGGLASTVALALMLAACGSNSTFIRNTVAAPDNGDAAANETAAPDPAAAVVITAAAVETAAPQPVAAATGRAGCRGRRSARADPGTEQLRLITSMAVRPTDGVVYYGLQDGYVWRRAADGTLSEQIDLTEIVSPHEPGSERGLLGLVVSPVDGRLFVYFTDDEIDSHIYPTPSAPMVPSMPPAAGGGVCGPAGLGPQGRGHGIPA